MRWSVWITALEYGTDRLEIQADAFENSPRVLVVDDLLATGGTAAATGQLVEQAGGCLVGFAFVIELEGLEGVKPCRWPARGRVVALRLTVLPVEDVFQLLQAQQPEAPQHDRERGLFEFRLALPQFQSAWAQPNAAEENAARRRLLGGCRWLDITMVATRASLSVWQGPPELHGAVTHGPQAELAQPRELFQQQQGQTPQGSNSGWRLENTRTRRSVATPTCSTSSQRLIP